LREESSEKWIVLDGKIQKHLLEFTHDTFDNLMVPNYGLISKEKYQKTGLEKVKIIIETVNSSQLPPSIFYNYSVSHMNPSPKIIKSLVQSFFSNEQIKKYLRSLNDESIQTLETILTSNLEKV
jgi:hypothetical protein